jgi:hypothetical protein
MKNSMARGKAFVLLRTRRDSSFTYKQEDASHCIAPKLSCKGDYKISLPHGLICLRRLEGRQVQILYAIKPELVWDLR